MKASTVEQFQVLEFIKANFNIDHINLELIDRYTMKLKINQEKK